MQAEALRQQVNKCTNLVCIVCVVTRGLILTAENVCYTSHLKEMRYSAGQGQGASSATAATESTETAGNLH